MKRILLLAVIAIIFISFKAAHSDISITRQYITRLIKIQNVNAFPEIVLIQYVGPQFGNKTFQGIVKQDSSLQRSSSRSLSYLLWCKKSYVDSLGTSQLPISEFIDCKKNPLDSSCSQSIHLLYSKFNIGDSVAFTNTNLFREELFYSLYWNNRKTISLYLSKRILHFFNGPTTSQTFLPPSDGSNQLLPTSKTSLDK